MDLTPEQQAFIDRVGRYWAEGLTQQNVANAMGKSLSTVRGRLASYGLKFGRNGKLVPIQAPAVNH